MLLELSAPHGFVYILTHAYILDRLLDKVWSRPSYLNSDSCKFEWGECVLWKASPSLTFTVGAIFFIVN